MRTRRISTRALGSSRNVRTVVPSGRCGAPCNREHGRPDNVNVNAGQVLTALYQCLVVTTGVSTNLVGLELVFIDASVFGVWFEQPRLKDSCDANHHGVRGLATDQWWHDQLDRVADNDLEMPGKRRAQNDPR